MAREEDPNTLSVVVVFAIAGGLFAILLWVLIFGQPKPVACYYLHDCKASQVSQLYMLLTGYWITPQASSVNGSNANSIITEPLFAFLLNTSQGWMLVDTGAAFDGQDRGCVTSPTVNISETPFVFVLPPQSISAQLQALNLTIANITTVIVSNLRFDKTGSFGMLPPDARIIVDSMELNYSTSENATSLYSQPAIASLPRSNLTLLSGSSDVKLLPGLTIIALPGVTPGLRGVVVELPQNRTVVLGSDAVSNIAALSTGSLPRQVTSLADAQASMKRLKTFSTSDGVQVFFSHDPTIVAKTLLT